MNETENNVMIEEIDAAEPAENISEPDEITENKDEVSLLKEELERLRAELKARDELETATSRMNAELSEFEEYFPEVALDEIPDEIWQRVKSGASLAASFSLLQRKKELEKRKINDFNEKNRKMSTGSINQGEGEKYFSPSEVKKMTPEQVKRHYDEIIESMRHWN